MTKIEVLESQNPPQAKVDIAFDRLLSYINDCTKEEVKNALDEMRNGHQPIGIKLFQEETLQNLGIADDDSSQANDDPVNHPNYYADGKIEVIDYIEDKNLGYHLGTAVKYISRAGKKHEQGMTDKEKEIQDLQKAVWFINRKIELLKNEN